MVPGHHNCTCTPSGAIQFCFVFFLFVGLDFKPKCYELVFSKVSTIRAYVLIQPLSITAVTQSGQPPHGPAVALQVDPLTEEGSGPGSAAWAADPAVEFV